VLLGILRNQLAADLPEALDDAYGRVPVAGVIGRRAGPAPRMVTSTTEPSSLSELLSNAFTLGILEPSARELGARRRTSDRFGMKTRDGVRSELLGVTGTLITHPPSSERGPLLGVRAPLPTSPPQSVERNEDPPTGCDRWMRG
jgi:hypothetical protein